MLDTQKEKLSLLMDNEFEELTSIDELTDDKQLQRCWHRYHVARDAIQGNELYDCALTIDISQSVAAAIEFEEIEQPAPEFKPISLFWLKVKDGLAKFSQVGLAACVTLGIIAGVQYQQGQSQDVDTPVLNTMPFGVNVSPVGGVPAEQANSQQDLLDQNQYNKLRLLLQDYELQKRLNTQ